VALGTDNAFANVCGGGRRIAREAAVDPDQDRAASAEVVVAGKFNTAISNTCFLCMGLFSQF
jgi:hypothetical protein